MAWNNLTGDHCLCLGSISISRVWSGHLWSSRRKCGVTSRLFRRRTIGCVPYNYKYGCVPSGLFRGVNIACFDVIEIDATPFMDADESRLIRTYGSIVIGEKRWVRLRRRKKIDALTFHNWFKSARAHNVTCQMSLAQHYLPKYGSWQLYCIIIASSKYPINVNNIP